MAGLGAMAIGVLVLIVAFTIIPIVGEQLDNSVTISGWVNESNHAEGYSNQWNSSVNSDIPTGVDLWTSVGGILKVAGLIIVVAGFLKTLQGMKSN